MSRLEDTKTKYQNALERLHTDEQYFLDYLNFSGRFYKIPAVHTISLYEDNPNATVFADYDTWKKYGNSVKTGVHSSAALIENGRKLKHYFDISQTTQEVIPFQWGINKAITEDFLKREKQQSGREYRCLASYINEKAVKTVSENAENILSKFSVDEADIKAFLYSVSTMVMTVIAARCEYKSSYKYKTPDVPDLSALHMLKAKEDTIQLCDTVQKNAKLILSQMEKSFTQIINIKQEELKNERNRDEQADRGMEQQQSRTQGGNSQPAPQEREAGNGVERTGTEVVSDVHDDGNIKRNSDLSAEQGAELHLQRSVLGHDEGSRADRTVRQEVAEIYGGELPRNSDVNEYQQLGLGYSIEESGQGSGGAVSDLGQTVSQGESPSHYIYGDSEVGKDEAFGNRTRSNDNSSAAISGGIKDNIAEKAVAVSNEAATASLSMSFEEQVDNEISGKLGDYENIKVCDTPKIFIEAGCKQLPMLYTQQHLRDAVKPKSTNNSHLHSLTIEQIKEIPYLLEKPAILFDSISPVKNGNNSIIAVLNKTDNDNSPIVVSIKPNGTGIYQLERVETNFITSIYGKDRGFKNYIERVAKSGNVLFWDKKTSQELFGFQGLQLPEALNNLDSNVIIHQSRNIVNSKIRENLLNKHDTYITLNAVRVGDFYEFYGDEAKIAAEKLGLTVTSRNGETMVGFPEHAFEQYKQKLEAEGYSLQLWEDYKQYGANKLISENADKHILPSLAFEALKSNHDFKPIALEVLDRIEKQMQINNYNTFDLQMLKIPIFQQKYGLLSRISKDIFDDKLDEIASKLNGYLAAPATEVVKTSLKEERIDSMDFEDLRKVQQLYNNDKSIITDEDTQDSNLQADADKPNNFTITDQNLGIGGLKTKCAANIAAIRTLKQIEAENRNATPEEQEILSKYVGWGGMAQEVFSGNKESWAKEHSEMKELLTNEEYTAAQGSTLNAHYTTPTVINAIYKALDNIGFKKGNVLEPAMGVGNFFGCLPEKMKDSKLYGVELDSITGRIAKQLYPNADIQIKGFEKTDFPDNFFDVAIGNVPFGNYGVADRKYDKHNFLIHDYFFAKTLDKVADGGIIAFVTSKGTLDKANSKVREYIAKRADLLGAIRLPDNTFKGNANTEVTADIIFLQKRKNPPVKMPDWVYLGETAEGVSVNQYFADNPEMILGKMEYSTKMYGGKNTTCSPFENEDLAEQLNKAVLNLQTNISIQARTEKQEKANGVIPATEDVRNFTHAVVDGKVYYRENDIMTEKTVKGKPATGKYLERILGLIELRDKMRELIDAQSQGCPDEELKKLQGELNTLYDIFTKKNGYINDKGNSDVFREDDDYNTLCALEIIDTEKHIVTKSDIFTKRTVKPIAEITHVDNPFEALQVSMDIKGRVDIPYMSDLCGSPHEQVIEQLVREGVIYLNPESEKYEEASEYLSGNVRQKLRIAELAAEANSVLFAKNIEALKKVIPTTIEAGEIKVRLGVSWIEPNDYQKFLCEYAKAHFREPLRRTFSGEYKVPKCNDISLAATSTYGTKRLSSYEIMERLLNNRDIIVKDTIHEPVGSKRYVINNKETQLAKDKARLMQSAFQRWLWEDPDRRQQYVTKYNELFNSIVGRTYDGSHQTFPEMSPYIELNPHQKDAVARAKYGGNTLFAHCVGAGKSFEMAASVMEKKRLGLINKACIVVPKHLVGQTANEWLRLYPQAKLLVASEKDFDKNNRQKFTARCCTGDYAAVIMSYEQFEKINMSFDYKKRFLDKEMSLLKRAISDTAIEDKGTIKDLEKAKKKLEERITKLLEGGKTKDTSLTFEQLGFDCLVVDEAHNYKNGLVVTKMSRVAGVQTTPAQKSEDILKNVKNRLTKVENMCIIKNEAKIKNTSQVM